MVNRQSGRLKRWSLNAALAAGSIVLVLVLAEAVLAALKINSRSIVRFVPGEGITYVPNAFYVHSKEGSSRGRINSDGFRDVERSHSKPPGVFRILVFGDSYVEAFQLPLERTFPYLLERSLNEHAGTVRFEVLNLGHSGFGTADAYQRYLHFGRQYEHDLVLLAFYLGNDIRNNSKALNLGRLAFYYELDESGHLVLDSSVIDRYAEGYGPLHRIGQWIKRRSYLASLVSERVFLLRNRWRERAVEPTLAGAGDPGGARLNPLADENLFLAEPDPRWSEAVRISEAIVGEFRDSVEREGARFALVSLGSAEMVDPRLQRAVRKRIRADLDFLRPHDEISAWAEREGVPHLGLTPIFLERTARTGVAFHGFDGAISGHWNERGHALAAREIERFLTEAGLIPGVGERSATALAR